MANARGGMPLAEPPRVSIDPWPESTLPAEWMELVDSLVDKVAVQHRYGPRAPPLLIDVPSPLALQAQLVARAIGPALTHGAAPPSVVAAVVRAQALPRGSPGLQPWQATLVRKIEAYRRTLGWRRVGAGRIWSESDFVSDLGDLFSHVPAPGPDETEGRHEALTAAFRGVRLVDGPSGRGRLTAAGVAGRWCAVLGRPFPTQRRARKSSRRVDSGVVLGLPRPGPLDTLRLFEPRARPSVGPLDGGEARLEGAWGTADGRQAVELAFAHPFVQESVAPVAGNHLTLLVDALVRLVTVGWFREAAAVHVDLVEDIVTRVRARDSALSLGQACWVHLVGWLLRPPGLTTSDVGEMQRAAAALVPDPALVEAVQRADEDVLQATTRRSTSPFVIARAWAELGGHKARWPQFLQRSRRATR